MSRRTRRSISKSVNMFASMPGQPPMAVTWDMERPLVGKRGVTSGFRKGWSSELHWLCGMNTLGAGQSKRASQNSVPVTPLCGVYFSASASCLHGHTVAKLTGGGDLVGNETEGRSAIVSAGSSAADLRGVGRFNYPFGFLLYSTVNGRAARPRAAVHCVGPARRQPSLPPAVRPAKMRTRTSCTSAVQGP